MSSPSTINVLAGVNGSGKSSIAGAAIREAGAAYYNPDEIAQKLRALHPYMNPQIANAHAWSMGRDLLQESIQFGKNFTFETTLGGKTITSLLLEAAAKGMRVSVWYAGLDSVEKNIARVCERVARGGHDIPEADIRKRWDSSRRNLLVLLPHLDRLRLYDNTIEADFEKGVPPQLKLLLAMENGRISGPNDLSRAFEWSKPIIAAAIRCDGR
ncbi:MAG: zeta toxin family protein [Verrucomicrobiota bacterium]